MVTISSINLWSITAQAIVPFTVENATETDEGGNDHNVVRLTYSDGINPSEIYRFSPNTSDDDLTSMVAQMNQGH